MLGGQRISLATGAKGVPQGKTSRAPWGDGTVVDDREAEKRLKSRTMTDRELLLGNSFVLALEDGGYSTR